VRVANMTSVCQQKHTGRGGIVQVSSTLQTRSNQGRACYTPNNKHRDYAKQPQGECKYEKARLVCM
jgi:hypothetical protein